MNKFQVGFTERFEKPPVQEYEESAQINKYLEGLDYQSASALAGRATELLDQNHPQIAELVKDLGGERVLAHTAAAFILTAFEKIYKG